MTQRVALYARVSTRELSPDLQLDALRVLAIQRGWQVVAEYVDQGVSGTRARRPELDRLLRDVHRGAVDVVAVWKFDRFARSTQQLVTALNDFRARNVEFVSVQDGIDTSTAAGRMVFGVIASLAEFERELIVEPVRAGLAAARRRGRRGGRPRGQVDVARARALRAQGRPLRAIAEDLGVGVATLSRALVERSKNPAA
jgi:DNA invertase Pin-like site-specific DNA recombinase